jgi:hypothetical protein
MSLARTLRVCDDESDVAGHLGLDSLKRPGPEVGLWVLSSAFYALSGISSWALVARLGVPIADLVFCHYSAHVFVEYLSLCPLVSSLLLPTDHPDLYRAQVPRPARLLPAGDSTPRPHARRAANPRRDINSNAWGPD